MATVKAAILKIGVVRDHQVSGGIGGGILHLPSLAVKFLGIKGTIIAVVVVGGFLFATGNLGKVLSLLIGQGGTSVTQSTGPL